MNRKPCDHTARTLAELDSSPSREHLATCPACREAAAVDAALRRFASDERSAAPRLPDPAVVYQRARIAASLAARSAHAARQRRRSLTASLAAWATGLGVAFGLWTALGWLRKPPEAVWETLAGLGTLPSQAGPVLLASLAFSGLTLTGGWLALRAESDNE